MRTQTQTQTRTAPCPKCQVPVTRPAVFFGSAEILADRPCLCSSCETQQGEADEWRSKCARLIPAKYRLARWDRVPLPGSPARAWRPGGDHPEGIGIIGPSGAGKTHLAALVVASMRIPFRWATSAELRDLSIAAVAGEGEARESAARTLALYRDARLLVIDDITESPFSEHWATWLWRCLEDRTNRLLPTIWTSQDDEGQIAARISRGRNVEASTADAIERRMCQGSRLVHLSESPPAEK